MSMLLPGVPIHQHWSPSKVLLSYLISVTGSYCTIQMMEQWRRVEGNAKTAMLVMSAITLGGCGIWCTHFTGMTALQLALDDGTILVVDFEIGLTILSLIFPIAGVFVGLKVASKDPYFIEVEQSRRKEMLVANLHNVKMSVAVNKDRVGRQIKIMALFSRLGRIVIGGAFAALGVLGMHYLGMLAQRTNADMTLHGGVVAASVIVAFFTANAAFWILFRALTFLPNNEALRLASALIMGVAVCGTHYSGMGAASYTVSDENYAATSRFVVNGHEAAIGASHGALLLCYWLLSFSVVRIARKRELIEATRATTHHDSVGQTGLGPSLHSTNASSEGHGASVHPVTVNIIHKPLQHPRRVEQQDEHEKSLPQAGNSVRKVYIAPDASEQT